MDVVGIIEIGRSGWAADAPVPDRFFGAIRRAPLRMVSAKARPATEQALAIRKRLLGPDSPYTALSLNNLGGVLALQGDQAGALSFFEQALVARRRVLLVWRAATS